MELITDLKIFCTQSADKRMDAMERVFPSQMDEIRFLTRQFDKTGESKMALETLAANGNKEFLLELSQNENISESIRASIPGFLSTSE